MIYDAREPKKQKSNRLAEFISASPKQWKTNVIRKL